MNMYIITSQRITTNQQVYVLMSGLAVTAEKTLPANKGQSSTQFEPVISYH